MSRERTEPTVVTPEDPRPPSPGEQPTAPQPASGDSPTAGYGGAVPEGGPSTPPPAEPPTEVLGSDGPPSGPSRPMWFIPVLLTVAVLAVAGVATAAVLKLTAGGPRPDEVVPGNALAFASLDLDPSAGQKIDAARFLRKFPAIRDQVRGEDLRRSLAEALLESDEKLSGISYDKDIEPWLGQRLGIAVLPPADGADEPQVVGALQVTDEDAAREGFRKLDKASGGSDSGVAFLEDYAVLAESQRAADRFAEAAGRRSLAEDARYAADMEALGETGVSSGWVNLGRVGEAVGAARPGAAADLGGQGLAGRLTYALRFTGDDLELAAKTVGVKGVRAVTGPGDVGLASLPATTAFAVGIANGDKQVPYVWNQVLSQVDGTPAAAQFDQFVAQIEAAGFALPEDLATLFGSSLTFAVDGEGLTGQPPRLGVRSVTDPDEATRILDRIELLVGSSFGQVIERRTLPDGVVVATDRGYADELATDGGLGGEPGFDAALPDVGSADLAMWLSMRQLEDVIASQSDDPDARQALAALDAIGLSMQATGEGSATYTLRVVTR